MLNKPLSSKYSEGFAFFLLECTMLYCSSPEQPNQTLPGRPFHILTAAIRLGREICYIRQPHGWILLSQILWTSACIVFLHLQQAFISWKKWNIIYYHTVSTISYKIVLKMSHLKHHCLIFWINCECNVKCTLGHSYAYTLMPLPASQHVLISWHDGLWRRSRARARKKYFSSKCRITGDIL